MNDATAFLFHPTHVLPLSLYYILLFSLIPSISFHPILSLPRPRSLYFLPSLCLAVLNSSSQCCPVIPTGWTFGTSESDSMSMNGESRVGRWCDFRPCAHPPNAPIMPGFSRLHLFPLPFTVNKAKPEWHGTHWEPINMPAGRVWLRAFVCVSMRTWGQAHQRVWKWVSAKRVCVLWVSAQGQSSHCRKGDHLVCLCACCCQKETGSKGQWMHTVLWLYE